MRKIEIYKMTPINGGLTQCETAGRIFGIGLVTIGIPLAGFAGVFIASFGAAALYAYDCDI